jgi:formylmethanofuran dehydrogenase subunit D
VKIKNTTVDLWITKELGASSVCLLSQFDYYPAGSILFDKLKAAGGDGVVVRAKEGDVVVNLTNAQVKTVPASYFEVPGLKQ